MKPLFPITLLTGTVMLTLPALAQTTPTDAGRMSPLAQQDSGRSSPLAQKDTGKKSPSNPTTADEAKSKEKSKK